MTKPNFASDTVWTGDNLPIMRGMNSDCIDLIYLDPPFNSNKHYEAPIGSKAAGASFKDAWTLDDVDVHEHGELADRNPAAYSVIEAARQAHGKGMQSYLIFMAVRLLEMHRIMKSFGTTLSALWTSLAFSTENTTSFCFTLAVGTRHSLCLRRRGTVMTSFAHANKNYT